MTRSRQKRAAVVQDGCCLSSLLTVRGLLMLVLRVCHTCLKLRGVLQECSFGAAPRCSARLDSRQRASRLARRAAPHDDLDSRLAPCDISGLVGHVRHGNYYV